MLQQRKVYMNNYEQPHPHNPSIHTYYLKSLYFLVKSFQ